MLTREQSRGCCSLTHTKKLGSLEKTTPRNTLLTVASLVGATYAMSMVFPWPVIAVTMAVVTLHELGHWYSAWCRGGDPYPPLFLPLGVATIGMTRVGGLEDLSSRAKRYIIASGPLTGCLTAVALLPFAYVIGGKLLVFTTLGLCVMELYAGLLGSDGKKWRREGSAHG